MKPQQVIRAIVLSFFFIGVVGCKTSVNDKISNPNMGTSVLIVNGCQYVIYLGYYGAATMVHAGNCNNPEHKLLTLDIDTAWKQKQDYYLDCKGSKRLGQDNSDTIYWKLHSN